MIIVESRRLSQHLDIIRYHINKDIHGGKMKKILIGAFLAIPLGVNADPVPFGLEIGKATIKEVASKYSVQKTGINKYSGGEMYELSGVKFDGLQNVTAIFSKDGKLLALLATLPQNKFDYLFNSLSDKYQLVSKNIPFVGDKSVKMVDGNTEITLEAPHMSFQMQMNYINKDLLKSYKLQSNDEEQQKQKQEQAQL